MHALLHVHGNCSPLIYCDFKLSHGKLKRKLCVNVVKQLNITLNYLNVGRTILLQSSDYIRLCFS